MQEISNKVKIGVSGGIGSFSEEAALEYCREAKTQNFELSYLISVENVLTALDKKEVELGVFPLENSNGGVVLEAIYAMAKHIFEIVKLFEIDVRHNLLVLSGIQRNEIKRIVSHDQALKQCRMYLKRKWPGIELKEHQDTAEAAHDLSKGLLPRDSAVICHQRCAELYGLEILEENIQDLKFNFTSFLAARSVTK